MGVNIRPFVNTNERHGMAKESVKVQTEKGIGVSSLQIFFKSDH